MNRLMYICDNAYICATMIINSVWRSLVFFFFSSRRRHTRCSRDWSSDVCSSDLISDGRLQTIRGSLIPKVASLEIRHVGLWIDHLDAFQSRFFLGIQTDSNVLCNGVSDLILQRQCIAEITLVLIGPQVLVFRGLNQIGRASCRERV